MKKTIRDISVKGKKCLVRLDLNVPIADGVITDENRINGALPTVKYLLENGAKVILCSHLGRPDGKVKPEFSLKPVADRLNELLDGKLTFASDVIGDSAKSAVAALKDGEAVLLENVRFHKEEELCASVCGKTLAEYAKDAAKVKVKKLIKEGAVAKADEKAAVKAEAAKITQADFDDAEVKVKKFCAALAEFAEIYVNDAFGTAHRAHCSTAGIVLYGFVKDAVSGFLIEKELAFLGGALENPKRPFVAILGGAKVSDKIKVIDNLIEKVDALLIGGGMAYTFKKALGFEVGNSICESDKVDLAAGLLKKAEEKGVKLLIPSDNVAANDFANATEIVTVGDNIPAGFMGMDIGPKTVREYAKVIAKAKTVVWNGPMGVFEQEKFAVGTKAVAEALSKTNAVTIIGGGDSAAAVVQLGYGDKVTHISTGGGASLEFLEGKALPGIECLNEKRRAIIAGNWKMNNTVAQTQTLVKELIPLVKDADCDVVICAPYTSLAAAVKLTKNTNIKVGAENVHWAAKGAFTGEISAEMLKELGVEYVIVGHSERRQFFGETDATVNLRAKAALAKGLKPIICVGELLSEREEGKTEEVVVRQTVAAFKDIPESELYNTVIAYEPVWAIGTGKTATAKDANETIKVIRNAMEALYGAKAAEAKVRIQYGGSMNPKNATELMSESEIDGGLIGGASLKAEDFSRVVNF
ncbi:MAG: triose-phosphate isomerase [Clostridiales bacterium]|jgi:triosephosphate isomerase|nr:triose-phosphate isomerase [Clostridiales bacterium]